MGEALTVATAVSIMSITLQLKNYRKPQLQRAVVRIMVMYASPTLLFCFSPSSQPWPRLSCTNPRVPLYAISSLIAIFSLEAAFFIDAVRDLYEVSPQPATRIG